MTPEILFIVAAGSGGHILPAVTLGQTWQQKQPQRSVMLFTNTSKLEQQIVTRLPESITPVFTPLAKISARRWYMAALFIPQALYLIIRSLYASLLYNPERVISTGGLYAIPVCLGAWLARRPIELYELNVVPGKAVQFLKLFACKIFCVFEETKRHIPEAEYVEYPIRPNVQKNTLSQAALIESINQQHGQNKNWVPFNHHRKTIFILGGSQGSLLLNKLIKGFLLAHPRIKAQIQLIHQTGAFEEASWEDFYRSHKIAALSFSYDPLITQYYQAADLIICRAGAGTLFEIAYFQRKCIVVPLIAASTSHQKQNAQEMAKKHPDLFTVISQDELLHSPEKLFERIKAIL